MHTLRRVAGPARTPQPMKLSEWLRGPVPKNDRIINAITAAALIALVAVTIWRNL